MDRAPLLLALLITATAIALIIWGARRPSVAPLLSIAWVIYATLWSAVPLVIQQILTEPIQNSSGPISRPQLALLHASVLFLVALIHLAYRRPLVEPVTRFFDRMAPPANKLLWPSAAVLVLLVVVVIYQIQITGQSYAEFAAFSVTADANELALDAVVSTVMGFAVGYFIALLTFGISGGLSKGTLWLAWCGMFVFCAFSVARGARAVVLLPIVSGVITLSTLHGRARRKATRLLLVFGAITVIVGAPVAGIMGVARGGSGDISFDLISEAYSVVFGGTTIGQQVQTLLSELNRKFDAVGPGVELLAMEPPGSGGMQPLFSAALSPIPRVLYPGKPVPISRDGTYLGTPYRIAAKAYGTVEVGMVVPVSASSISIWEYGVIGPLLLVLANLLNLVLLNSVFMSRNVIARAFGISMMGLPNVEFFLASPSMLLQNNLRLVLYLSALAVASLAWAMLAKSRHSSSSQPELA